MDKLAAGVRYRSLSFSNRNSWPGAFKGARSKAIANTHRTQSRESLAEQDLFLLNAFRSQGRMFKLFSSVCFLVLCCQGQVTLTSKGSLVVGEVAEISAFDPATKRLFSTNAAQNRVEVSQLGPNGSLTAAFSLPMNGVPNSVAIHNGVVAIAVENTPRTSPGIVKFYTTGGQFLAEVSVGAVPDMLVFTPNGRRLLVANEGEPNSYKQSDSVDPKGSVSIIDLTAGIAGLDQSRVRTARFLESTPRANAASIRVYGPNATFAQDMEPEYITVSRDSQTAWVTLQENNAIAELDIESAEFRRVTGLGFKNFNQIENALDPSDRDGGIHIASWPVFGMYEPDSIDSYRVGGDTYLVLANEGDTRDYTGFNEESRVKDLTLDPAAFPAAATLRADANLGRLTVTNANGDTDGDKDFDRLFVPGGRSFSIRRPSGELVWDSKGEIEQKTAELTPLIFNSKGTADTFDTRSDNKGPEPEGLVIGKAFGRDYAFIGLERTGGVMVYDISNPQHPFFVQYVNTAPANLAPEGLIFVKADDSPTGLPLVIVSYEVSGSVEVFEVNKL